MSQNTEVALKQAFSLIEAGNLEDARAILRPILESDKDNADVWWLYSHAVTDPETARLALNNVLRIEPDYPDARDLLNQLETQQKDEQFEDFPDADKEPAFIPPMPSSIPGIKPLPTRSEGGAKVADTDADELPEDMFEEEEGEAFYRRPLFYVPLITILLLAALAIVIIKPFAVNSPSPQTTETGIQTPVETIQSSALEVTSTTEVNTGLPTSTFAEVSTTEAATPTLEGIGAASATLTPVESSTESTTAVPPTVENTTTDIAPTVGQSGDVSAVAADFSGFTLSSGNPVSIDATSLGQTLRVSVCASAGKEMRELLPKAMETLAKSSVNYASQAQAISVQMVDCSANSTLLWIGSSIDDAVAFANSTLSDKDYQAKWRPVTSS